jgi:hypothetical protein
MLATVAVAVATACARMRPHALRRLHARVAARVRLHARVAVRILRQVPVLLPQLSRANGHPHLHLLVTDGGFRADGTFVGHTAVWVSQNDRAFAIRRARYCARSPVALERLTYDRAARFLILTVQDCGNGKDGNALWVRDLTARDSTWMTVVTGFDDRVDVLDNDGASHIGQTNSGVRNGRVVRIDPARPAEANGVTLVPERAAPLPHARTAGQRIFAGYLKDVR